jgi:phosphoglycolate phosphatase
MRFKNKKLLIFDLDGTLINSIPDLALAINKMLESINIGPLPLEKVKSFIGNGAKTLVTRSLNYTHNNNVPEELFDKAFPKFMSSYKANPCEETFLYSGVEETLQYLKDKGYKMMICTNKPIEFVEPILEKLNIKKYFQKWIGENSLSEKKPSGEPLLHLAKEANVAIEDCLMIGDSKNDILSASNAKMENIGLSYGYNYNEDINQFNPTVVLNEFITLKTLL